MGSRNPLQAATAKWIWFAWAETPSLAARARQGNGRKNRSKNAQSRRACCLDRSTAGLVDLASSRGSEVHGLGAVREALLCWLSERRFSPP